MKTHFNKRIFPIFLLKFLICILFIIIYTTPSYTQEKCSFEDKTKNEICKIVKLIKELESVTGITHNKVIAEIAKKISLNTLKKEKMTDEKRREELKKQNIKLLEKTTKDFWHNSPLLSNALPSKDLFSDNNISISFRKLSPDDYEISLMNGTKTIFLINNFISENCKNTNQELCDRTLEEIKSLVRITALWHLNNHIEKKKHLEIVLEKIVKLDESWKKYTEKSRSQTLWELAINTYLFRDNDEFEYLFQPPPSFQLIFLHPSIVYEYMDSSVDGEQSKATVALEILGFDIWREKNKWYIPTGLSGTLNYADRSDVNDLGGGFLIHFDHTFSIGYANYKDHDAVVFSIDLMKLIDSKKENYYEYKSKWTKFTKN